MKRISKILSKYNENAMAEIDGYLEKIEDFALGERVDHEERISIEDGIFIQMSYHTNHESEDSVGLIMDAIHVDLMVVLDEDGNTLPMLSVTIPRCVVKAALREADEFNDDESAEESEE